MSRESQAVSLSRRSFLKAVGASAAMLPFYSLLENNFVRAQTAEMPLRFAGLGYYHGQSGSLWARQAGETNTNFSLTYDHSPFSPFDDAATYGKSFKDRLGIFEGFDYAVGEIDSKGKATHVPMHGAMGLLLTGSCKDDDKLHNASIDQYLAAKYGGETRFRSVQLRGLDHIGFPLDTQWCMSFDANGTALAPLHQPSEIFDKYFSSAIVGTDQAAIAAAARKRAIGASVLDFASADLQRLRTRLAGGERIKLDQHLTIIRGLEKRLASNEQQGAMCAPPTRQRDYDKFTQGTVLPCFDFSMELLVEILACDLSRFVTFLMPNDLGPAVPHKSLTVAYDNSQTYAVDGTQDSSFPVYDNMHDNVAHRLSDGNGANAVLSQRMVSAVQRLYFTRIAKFMQRLDEAEMLDSTVIMAGSDGGHGSSHGTTQIPILLAGGANGKLKLGKRIVAPTKTARVADWCATASYYPHNPILVSVLNLFGENVTSYGTCGNADYLKGVSSLLG